MLQFVTRRLLLAIPVLFGILFVTFILARAIPGDPCKAMLGEKASAEACEAFAEKNGLNESFPVQVGKYMGQIVTGDFGSEPMVLVNDLTRKTDVRYLKVKLAGKSSAINDSVATQSVRSNSIYFNGKVLSFKIR